PPRSAPMRSALLTAVVPIALALCAACAATTATVRLTEDWPAAARDYDGVVRDWTRKAQLRATYQEICELVATIKSVEWRAAYAARDASLRGLTGAEREQRIAQARADAAGPYEVAIMLTTWDR